MIGNDVIDLKLAQQESNWQRKGYLDKLFSEAEQAFIFNAKNQTEMVWILWSIKESVYKAYLRIEYNRGFYPSKIEITSLEQKQHDYYAEITLFKHRFNGKSTVNLDFIHTIATHSDCEIDKVVALKLATQYYKDSNGLPLDYSNNYISVSHHGDYKKMIGYAEVVR
ncbi:4'-phosphopantetheinyl transferase family protein [Flavobacterium sp.]